jgi:hypothetical protein
VRQQRFACRIDTAAALSSSDICIGLAFGASLPEETQAHEDQQRLLEGRDNTSLV